MITREQCDKLMRSIESLLVNSISPEANQRLAESGTTDCSSGQDARLSKENRAFQPVGDPAECSEFEDWLEKEISKSLKQVLAGGDVEISTKHHTLRRCRKAYYRSKG